MHAGCVSKKVAFFASLFAAPRRRVRTAVGERRHGPRRVGAGSARRLAQGVPATEREYLSLTDGEITAHLSGELEMGLCPLLDGDRYHRLATDLDGPTAMLDVLAYLMAARGVGTSGTEGVSVRAGSTRLAVLHRPRPCGHRATTRHRAAARGHRGARSD